MMTKTFFWGFFFLPFLSVSQTLDTILITHKVDSLLQLSRNLTNQRQFDKAFELNEAAEKMALKKSGKVSSIYGNCCFNRGRIFHVKGNFKEAIVWYIQSKEIRETAIGTEHLDYAESLNNLGYLYKQLGEYAKAEPLLLKCASIRKEKLGEYHDLYGHISLNLGNLYLDLADYSKAESYYLQTKDVFKKVYGKDHYWYAQILNNLGVLYKNWGQYEKALSLHLEAERIIENGKFHWYYEMSFRSLGNLYLQLGEYKKAEYYLQKALAHVRSVKGETNQSYIEVLNSLALLYDRLGNYQKAETYYLESIAGYESSNSVSVFGAAKPLFNLGNLYHIQGKYEKAEIILRKALVLNEEFVGKSHFDYTTNLASIGRLYMSMGKLSDAENLLLEVKTINKKNLGKNHYILATDALNLVTLYIEMGEYEKAEVFSKEVESILVKGLGKNNSHYIAYLRKMVDLHLLTGKMAKAENTLTELFELEKSFLTKASQHLSEVELFSYIQTFEQDLDRFYSKALDSVGFNSALFYKGFLLNNVNETNKLVANDTSSLEQYHLLKSYRRRLASEYTKPIAERKNVTELEATANELEKKLVRNVAGFGDAFREVTWKQVQGALKEGEAAIEFVHYNKRNANKSDSILYAALVLRPEDDSPHFVSLFEARQLQKLLKEHPRKKEMYFNQLYGQGATDMDNSNLCQLIWQPLNDLLRNVKTVYAAPSGLFHRINLGAIMIDKNQTFAERHSLITLSSTRQLTLDEKLTDHKPLTATLYGGIEYDMDSIAIANADKNVVPFKTEAFSFKYSERSDRGLTFEYLPATDKEVEQIGAIIRSKNEQLNTLKSYQATETSFKQLGVIAPSPTILHLATHGYFRPDPKEKFSEQIDLSDRPAFKFSDHAMIRSGLVLAGGNHVWQGKPAIKGIEDGMLTAYEVSQVDLSNTDLVVLSACDTGLGDIEGNEGVYGLQRAFKIAGVKHLIMSLWSVPDEQTQEMMVAFYKNWLNKDMPLNEAFRAAQKAMREKYSSHYYWAGFVLIE